MRGARCRARRAARRRRRPCRRACRRRRAGVAGEHRARVGGAGRVDRASRGRRRGCRSGSPGSPRRRAARRSFGSARDAARIAARAGLLARRHGRRPRRAHRAPRPRVRARRRRLAGRDDRSGARLPAPGACALAWPDHDRQRQAGRVAAAAAGARGAPLGAATRPGPLRRRGREAVQGDRLARLPARTRPGCASWSPPAIDRGQQPGRIGAPAACDHRLRRSLAPAARRHARRRWSSTGPATRSSGRPPAASVAAAIPGRAGW